MRKSMFFGVLAVLLFVIVAGAPARSAVALVVNVPFDFYVGKDLLPAGTYRFEMGGMTPFTAKSSSLVVRGEDGNIATRTFTLPESTHWSAAQDRLLFNRYGSTYFLARIECLEFQAGVRKTGVEKELSAQMGKAKNTVLIAQR
jgi:hypothetical protein